MEALDNEKENSMANDAKAFVAKVMSDEALAKEIGAVKSEADFDAIAKKLGFDVKAKDFEAAFKEARNGSKELSDAQMEQVAGGLSIVGVDYAFTVVQTVK